MREISYADAIIEALSEEMDRDERVFVMGEDVGRFGMVYLSRPELWKKFGDHRVLDTPISENAIVGFALGAALTGMRPIADIMFCDLMTLAMDQIVNQAAKMRYMLGGNVSVPLVINTSFGGFRNAAAQHSQNLESWFTHVPGLKVVAPSTPHDVKGILKSAIREDNPVIVFEHQILLPTKGPVEDDEYTIPLGTADIKREGKDLTVVSYSLMLHKALRAAEELEAKGVSVEIIDLRSLYPLDKDSILKSVEKTGRLLIVHQASITSGFGAEIAAIVAQEGFELLVCPIQRLGGLDVPIPFSPELESFVIPDERKIVEKALNMVSEST